MGRRSTWTKGSTTALTESGDLLVPLLPGIEYEWFGGRRGNEEEEEEDWKRRPPSSTVFRATEHKSKSVVHKATHFTPTISVDNRAASNFQIRSWDSS